jgi:hypothetical protein
MRRAPVDASPRGKVPPHRRRGPTASSIDENGVNPRGKIRLVVNILISVMFENEKQ